MYLTDHNKYNNYAVGYYDNKVGYLNSSCPFAFGIKVREKAY